jgi:pimeloyl-ACP methyl ester carboxylesterase
MRRRAKYRAYGSALKAAMAGIAVAGACVGSSANAQIVSGGDRAQLVSIPLNEGSISGVGHRKAFVNGIRLHYMQAGKGPVVLLLHGWANTSYAWHHVIPLLSGRYTVIAPDLRGMGDSSRPLAGYDREAVAKDILELLDQLGVKSALVVGHDLGAHIGFELAARSPGRVAKLVVLDGVVPGIPPWDQLTKDGRLWHWGFYNVPDLPEALIQGKERTYFSWFIRNFAVNIEAVDADMDAVVKAYSEPGAVRGGLGMFRTIAADAKRNATWLESNKLEMPVLALGGSMGVGPVLLQQMQAAGKQVRGGVIQNCGHWLATECPQTLVEQMKAFFDEEAKK